MERVYCNTGGIYFFKQILLEDETTNKALKNLGVFFQTKQNKEEKHPSF